jgi:hypothetical protein
MSVPSLRNLFQANRYPGRSVVWARTLDGAMCGGYVLTGHGADRLLEGQPAAVALDGLDYEPDPPIFTPRITVIVDVSSPANAWFGARPISTIGWRRRPSGPAASPRRPCATRVEAGTSRSGGQERAPQPVRMGASS